MPCFGLAVLDLCSASLPASMLALAAVLRSHIRVHAARAGICWPAEVAPPAPPPGAGSINAGRCRDHAPSPRDVYDVVASRHLLPLPSCSRLCCFCPWIPGIASRRITLCRLLPHINCYPHCPLCDPEHSGRSFQPSLWLTGCATRASTIGSLIAVVACLYYFASIFADRLDNPVSCSS
jgi:hypothetical protein